MSDRVEIWILCAVLLLLTVGGWMWAVRRLRCAQDEPTVSGRTFGQWRYQVFFGPRSKRHESFKNMQEAYRQVMRERFPDQPVHEGQFLSFFIERYFLGSAEESSYAFGIVRQYPEQAWRQLASILMEHRWPSRIGAMINAQSSIAVRSYVSSIRDNEGQVGEMRSTEAGTSFGERVLRFVEGVQSVAQSDLDELEACLDARKSDPFVLLHALAGLGEEGKESVVRSFQSTDSRIRAAAARVFGTVHTEDENVISLIVGMMSDVDQSVREAALGAVVHQDSCDNIRIPALVGALSDPDVSEWDTLLLRYALLDAGNSVRPFVGRLREIAAGSNAHARNVADIILKGIDPTGPEV